MKMSEALKGLARQAEIDMRAAFAWDDSIRIFVNDAAIPEDSLEHGEVEITVPEIRKLGPQHDKATVHLEVLGRFPAPADGLRFDVQVDMSSAARAKFTPTLSIDGRNGYGTIDGKPIGKDVVVTMIDFQDLEANANGCVEVGLKVEMTCEWERAVA